MKLTKNTKLYSSTNGKTVNVTYRTLNVTELSIIERIKNPYLRSEMAYELGYISGNEPNFLAKHQIGLDIIESSNLEMNDETLLGLTIDDFRSSVKNDFVFNIITNIISVLPSTSIEYLLNLTYLDLLELGALCEKITNKKIFNVSQSLTKTNEVVKDGKKFFDDNDGKSMQEKMKELSNF